MGKSACLRPYFPNDDSVLWIDLLNPEEKDRYTRNALELAGWLFYLRWTILELMKGAMHDVRTE